MKHITDLAKALYVWPSRTRHGGASPARFLPQLIVSLTSAALILWDEGFLPAAFAKLSQA